MLYVTRRRLTGVTTKRVTLRLNAKTYEDLQAIKGSLNNSDAIERLIAEKKARLERRRAAGKMSA